MKLWNAICSGAVILALPSSAAIAQEKKPAAPAAQAVPKTAPKPDPASAKVEKVSAPPSEIKPSEPAPRAHKPSRANEDARACLNLDTDTKIIRCAEKFL